MGGTAEVAALHILTQVPAQEAVAAALLRAQGAATRRAWATECVRRCRGPGDQPQAGADLVHHVREASGHEANAILEELQSEARALQSPAALVSAWRGDELNGAVHIHM